MAEKYETWTIAQLSQELHRLQPLPRSVELRDGSLMAVVDVTAAGESNRGQEIAAVEEQIQRRLMEQLGRRTS